MKVIPLFGAGTAHKSYVVTRQRRLNAYYENRPDGDKSKIAVYGTPGVSPIFKINSSLNLPMRGFAGDSNYLYAVSYNQFIQCSPLTGTPMNTATINTFSGLASIQVSPTQVVIVDGNTGYCYTIASMTLIAVVSWPATGARTVTYCSGFFVAEQPGTQTFWVSNAFDGSTWNALSFASASGSSGVLLAVDQLNGVLILFLSQAMEFWQNVGAVPQPFQPILSAYNEWGLGAIFSRVHADQSIIFLGITKDGVVQLVKLTGYTTQVISDADTENIWNGFTTVSDAVAMTYQVDHHIMYQITFPSANRSWIFDQSTGIPSEVQTGSQPGRHWGNLSAVASSQNFISDFATNQIYLMSQSQFTDNGQTIIREVISRHVLSQFNRVRISLIYLDMETGVGLQTGQGSNPQIMMQSSKDNGRTWSAERWTGLGAIGNYFTRVVWRRFGSARDYVFRIRMSDPVKFVITEGAIKLSERQPAAKLG
jgi:hypothetical protein